MHADRTAVVASIAIASLAIGCSSSSATASTTTCTASFSGNLEDSAELNANCAALTAVDDDAGVASGYALTISASTTQIALIDISITLSATPATGEFSTESVSNWSVVAQASANQCEFGAGNLSVPAGSFTLTLTSLDVASGTAHGTISMTMFVHAPPAVDCGPGNEEDVLFTF